MLAIVGGLIALASVKLGNWVAGDSTGTVWQNASITYPTNQVSAPIDAEVRSGKAAFIKPSDMRVGSWYPLEFLVGPSLASVAEEAEDLPLTTARPIFVSRNMRVVLLPDPNFEIKSKSKALQDTGSDLSATWQWDVRPLTAGTHTLIAQAEVLKRNPSGYVVLNRYSRRVAVRVGVGTLQAVINDIRGAKSLGDALTALLTSWRATLLAFALCAGAFFVARRAVRKRRKNSGPSGKGPKSVPSDSTADDSSNANPS